MPTPLELAEGFNLYLPPRAAFLQVVKPEYVLTTGNSGANVTRLRLGEGKVEQTLVEVRATLAGHELETCTWWCGELATPADLPERLLALGLVPDDEAPTLVALVLGREPDGKPEPEVRRVETFGDFQVAMAIDMESTDTPAPVRARREARMRDIWDTSLQQGAVHYLGYLDGRPVAMARAFFLGEAVLLLGAATLPACRGRGVYQALIHARWRDAVGRGMPQLVVHAGPMSRPILERVGFRKLGEIRLLVDRL